MTAPTLNSLRRIVSTCVVSRADPFKPNSRKARIRTSAAVEKASRSWLARKV